MKLSKRIQILSSWCAISTETAEAIFPALVMSTPQENDKAWQEMLEIIDAPSLIRMLAMIRTGRLQNRISASKLDSDRLTFDNGHVLWDGQPIGELHTYYKTVLPYEAQARVAYDIFFDRFVAFIGKNYKVVVLKESDLGLELFVPEGKEFELERAWNAFIKDTFSAKSLEKNFAPLVNTIKMTDKGFSALDIPIVSEEQALFLAAFYLVNLQSLQRGDDNRRREIEELEKEMEHAVEKRQQQIEKNIAKLESELQSRLARYEPLYHQVELLRQTHPIWMKNVDQLIRSKFRPLAGTQIAKATAKIGKCVAQLNDLANLKSSQLYQFSPLLTSLAIAEKVRLGGDATGKVCYACGRDLPKQETVYKVNKFIFESPSQRLQSGGSQTQPTVCGICAAVSFVSPIKLGKERLVVRMREKGRQGQYLVDEQLRMLILGEMNLVAGKYVMLQARETVGSRAVFDALGGLQYALYKVGTSFEPEVFEQYELEALITNDTVTLPSRHLAWMHWLALVFNFRRSDWQDKGQFAAFGQAIRHIQKEEVLFAIYELLKAGLASLPLGAGRANQLEKLREEHVRWLMDSKSNRAEFFKDVAAVTGLLYAFCSYVRSEVKKSGGNERIEVRKAIERSVDPFHFDYTVADNTRSEAATLYRQSDMYFSYDQLKVFLVELGVDPNDRESTDSKGQLTLRLYFDDVINAYTYLFEKRYKTTKEQRDFTYELKLSLHARFPELIDSDKKGD